MLKGILCLLVGTLAWGLGSCSVQCPDGTSCSDLTTCCWTEQGYRCCPYPNAVCCPDKAHCCPPGHTCNLVTRTCDKQGQPWMAIPMVQEEAAEEKPTVPLLPSAPTQELQSSLEQSRSSVVWCDSYTYCPNGNTCCRHPKGGWFCCPLSPARCCLDGFHCCPYGYDCDHSYTHCVRQSLRYPFPERRALASVPASHSLPEDKSSLEEKPRMVLTEAMTSAQDGAVIRCDDKFYCPTGRSCCKGAQGQWSCCPYKLGQCCADGIHCCEYGYTCSATSSSCQTRFAQML